MTQVGSSYIVKQTTAQIAEAILVYLQEIT